MRAFLEALRSQPAGRSLCALPYGPVFCQCMTGRAGPKRYISRGFGRSSPGFSPFHFDAVDSFASTRSGAWLLSGASGPISSQLAYLACHPPEPHPGKLKNCGGIAQLGVHTGQFSFKWELSCIPSEPHSGKKLDMGFDNSNPMPSLASINLILMPVFNKP